MKSGTSSLYHYLGQHPDLQPSYKKEVHFFDGGLDPDIDNFGKGSAWYRSHFPARQPRHKSIKSFEATPLYIFNPLTPRRIHDLAPRAKLIAVLRNPTERAVSHYFHEVRQGRESLPIMEAMTSEETRLKESIDNKNFKSLEYIHFSYKGRGRYIEQLISFFELFPSDQLLLLNSDDLFSAPDKVLKKIFEFVGVDAGFEVRDLEARNVTRNRKDVDEEVYAYLDTYFAPYNAKLFEAIGETWDW
jgi:hypothetical protein